MNNRTISEGPQSSSQSGARYVPSRPFLTAVVIGYSFLFVLTACLFLAVLVSRESLHAQPPRLSWHFAAVVLGGTCTCATVQLALLYYFKERGFWPRNGKQWLQRVGPAFALMAVALLPGLICVWNPSVAIAGVSMLLGVAFGMVPTMLCFADWLQHRIERGKETIQLRSVDRIDLPKSVQGYFDKHTDELHQMGFEKLGDYRLKQYTATYARFFLNREQHTFAEISHTTLGISPLKAVCFFSVTPGGHYLESSNARWGKRQQTRYFELQVLPQTSHQEVYEQHQTRLAELDQGQALPLGIDDLEATICYGNKQLYEVLIAQGLTKTNPYADFDESQLVPSRSGSVGEWENAIFESPVEDMSVSV